VNEGEIDMDKVIAALDNSVAAAPVLATATSFAQLLGVDVEAVHAKRDGQRTPEAIATAAGVPLRTLTGEPVEALVDAGAASDVVALVIGARSTPAGKRPVGATALAVMRALAKPLLVVPPDAAHVGRLRSVLVPLEGTVSTSFGPRSIMNLAHAAELDVVVVHVRDEESLPSFTDQPQHETSAWAHEFLARYCPWGIGKVRLETRVGVPEQEILRAAEENEADLIALAWSQELPANRAPVVRTVLERGRVPVLLIPVRVANPSAAPRTERKEPSWKSSPSLRA
jgi:nucleotide-binding universal stress UspA family protein